jgi:hypothetical protein
MRQVLIRSSPAPGLSRNYSNAFSHQRLFSFDSSRCESDDPKNGQDNPE